MKKCKKCQDIQTDLAEIKQNTQKEVECKY